MSICWRNSSILLYNLCRSIGNSFYSGLIMSTPANSARLGQVEYNLNKAEFIKDDINQKLADLACLKSGQTVSGGGDAAKKFKMETDEEYEKLVEEIEKWKEILTITQIKNGRKLIRYSTAPPKELGSSTPISKDDNQSTTIEQLQPGGSDQKKKETSAQKVDGKQTDKDSANKTEQTKPKEKEQKTKAPKEQAKTKTSGGGGGGAPPQAGGEDIVDVSRLDFRIGKIVEVDKHPDADSLYLEKVDVGEPNPRTVVSGLVKHVPIEEMRNRMVVLLCNLKPAKMRGVTSEAMVMCASSPDKVEILIPPEGAVPGDLVDFDGFTRNPDPVLNPKKKIFETVAPDLKTDSNKIATYKSVPFTVKGKGIVTAPSLVNVNIK